MSSPKLIINTFEGGMDWDSHPSALPNNKYRRALNMIYSDGEQDSYITNEYGEHEFVEFGANIVGANYISYRNQTLVFLDNGELWLADHNTNEKIFVCSDKEFNCDWGLSGCEWIGECQCTFKTMQPCNELQVYWSSSCVYFTINIDEMLNPIRKQALKDSIKRQQDCASDPDCAADCNIRGCDFFKLVKPVCPPKILTSKRESGGGLQSGVYEFSARLLDQDDNSSNWSDFSRPVIIGSKHNISGEKGFGSIEVRIENLDCKFSQIELAVTKTTNDVQETFSLGRIPYIQGGISYLYTGQPGEVIDITEVLTKRKLDFRGQCLIQKDNQLFLYRIKQERNLDYQRRAHQIEVGFREVIMTYEEARKNNFTTFMRGEAYRFSIHWNFDDGTTTKDFIINLAESTSTSEEDKTDKEDLNENKVQDETNVSLNEESISTSSDENFTVTYTPQKYTRNRVAKENTPGNTETDPPYEDTLKDMISQMEADMADFCEAHACEDCAASTAICNANRDQVDTIVNDWLDMLGEYNLDKVGVKEQIDYSSGTMKEAAEKIIESIKNRERITPEKGEFTVSAPGEYSQGKGTLELRSGGDSQSDTITINNEKYKLGRYFKSIPSPEKNSRYSYSTNCEGEYIHGSLAGQPINNHRTPSERESPYYFSKSRGVPSKFTPDADEYKDGYVVLLALEVRNIQFPENDELSKNICKSTPYTITGTPRTEANKTVRAKGLAIKSHVASYQGKSYVYSRHIVNSSDTVERTIDINGSRIGPGTNHNSFTYFSPSTMALKAAMNITGVVPLFEAYGIGARHGLYAEGKKPDNQLYGTQTDMRGATCSVNLSQNVPLSANYDAPTPCTGSSYVECNDVGASPSSEMSTMPLMNKWKESTLWVGASLPPLTKGKTANSDSSFTGDGLDHCVPIEKAAGQIVALVTDLEDQYGNVTNNQTVPLLYGSDGNTSVIGLCGDCYIGPFTIKRSAYISEKVGNKFPIANGSSTDGRLSDKKEDRSVCDSPEDVVHGFFGNWYASKLPITGDVADAKNWANLHFTGSQVRDWKSASDQTAPESDFYYPKTVSGFVTFWVESDVAPWLMNNHDELAKKRYPYLDNYHISSNAPDKHPWEDSVLNQFGFKQEQPSVWKRTRKNLIRSLINVGLPILGITQFSEIGLPTELAGLFVETTSLAALWALLSQVIFTNDALDKMLGFPICRTDDEGGEDESSLMTLVDNHAEYDLVYSKISDNLYEHIPDIYNTCDCSNCMNGDVTNEIVYSNQQNLSSEVDAYRQFEALDYSVIPADAGLIQRLFVNAGAFYAHTSDGIWRLQFAQSQVPQDLGGFLIGTGGLLATPILLGEGSIEGEYGILDPNASISTQYGYFFIDREGNKIYQFNNGIHAISDARMRNFFRKYIKFCGGATCTDEKVNGRWYSMGIDPFTERLLFTKKDSVSGASYTISYDLRRKVWISFHSYVPNAYIWDRGNMFTVQGSKILRHAPGNEQMFGGKECPIFIEYIVSHRIDNQLQAFELQGVIIDSETNIGDLLNREAFFDHIAVWNTHQSTGLLPLKLVDQYNKRDMISTEFGVADLVYKQCQWRINDFYDYAMDPNKPLVETSDCSPFIKLVNTDVSPPMEQDFMNRILEDRYHHVMLLLDKKPKDFKIYLRYSLFSAQKSDS